MKATILVFALAATLLVGCDADNKSAGERKDKTPATTTPAPDNTDRNERDQGGQNTTPVDQKENATDLDITQKIRQGVMAADSLSMNAKNVKIVTADRMVTLRGVVANQDEKRRVVAIAVRIAGEKNVSDMLEIAPK